SQGVRVMNIRDDDQVSAVALVIESDGPTAAAVADDEPPLVELDGADDDAELADEDELSGDDELES
ncbi:MAG TPA: hypothetical protein VGI55_06085, partial [Solirubrobacteraceae bacterium]